MMYVKPVCMSAKRRKRSSEGHLRGSSTEEATKGVPQSKREMVEWGAKPSRRRREKVKVSLEVARSWEERSGSMSAEEGAASAMRAGNEASRKEEKTNRKCDFLARVKSFGAVHHPVAVPAPRVSGRFER